MTTTISPDEYCKNPQDYDNYPGIDDKTKQYWSEYCQLKNKIDKGIIPDKKGLGDATIEGLTQFIEGVFSPEGLAFLGILIGAKIPYRAVKSGIGSLIKNGLSEEMLKNAEEFIAKGGDAVISNGSSILSSVFKNSVYVDVKLAEEVGYTGGRYATSMLFKGLEAGFEVINEVLMVLMIISMIFDAWDPCKLNIMLTADVLKDITMQFNNQFRQVLLQNINAVPDSYGHTILTANWPIEYYADRSILQAFKNDVYDPIRQKLMFKYLNSLQVNSCGLPIVRKKGGISLTNDKLRQLENSLMMFIGNNNTIVANWLYTWLPYIIGSIMLFLMFFIGKKYIK